MFSLTRLFKISSKKYRVIPINTNNKENNDKTINNTKLIEKKIIDESLNEKKIDYKNISSVYSLATFNVYNMATDDFFDKLKVKAKEYNCNTKYIFDEINKKYNNKLNQELNNIIKHDLHSSLIQMKKDFKIDKINDKTIESYIKYGCYYLINNIINKKLSCDIKNTKIEEKDMRKIIIWIEEYLGINLYYLNNNKNMDIDFCLQ